ncbi:dimethyl sulfoxide reductase anchor subunit family protein [Arenimonas sp.]|uniref:dimethyl sulfoxide reductase anchor subunit family protein n=1 Tax=Arenimonas sp. TaxID=1872635 RepID=UPI002E34DDDF|nr:DmsC/YnfH family molybdoenzyme membrane anchor subunit [Arenimonas sp.]HEX4854075.1 DmsC/YnfH family molybdoenzyme membrane anchor subunit [Arenimonas sp.]
MHPAFSVIFFTTLSGAGYGLWFWAALALWGFPPGKEGLAGHGIAMLLGFVLVTAGLLSSTLHLGKPLRAWRAFSQWRSSWLSREGVLALACYLPFVALLVGALTGSHVLKTMGPTLLLLLALLSLATVACTAMIYASLTPIPAWSNRRVVPVYLLFALHTGGILLAWLLAAFSDLWNLGGLAIIFSSALLAWLKHGYWRAIDGDPLPATRASALGLPPDRVASVFERPHTEANYLTTEMGHVLARKHARRLRVIAVLLFAVVPALCALPVWLLPHANAAWPMGLAAVSAMLGAAVERWLFFAQARHVVTLYY